MQFQQCAKNAHLNFPEPNVMSSDNSLKHKDGSYIFISDTEKQQILTFKRLNQQFFSLLYLKNDGINLLLIKIVGNYFSIYQLINELIIQLIVAVLLFSASQDLESKSQQ